MNVFDYNNISLVPKKSIVNSRSQCDTSIDFGKNNFSLPVIPANMSSVINEDLAIELASNGFFYIMHRFDIDIYEFVEKMNSLELITSISIGVNKDSYLLLDRLVESNLKVDYITIDIAHGHCDKMKNIISYIKNELKMNTFLICGNICTKDALLDLIEWGADSVKVGIAPGEACTTYHSTAFGSRGYQASIVNELSNISTVPIIADGGIRQHGHVNVALSMGATMVMIGGMLSCFVDSPGNIIFDAGKPYKEYWGSASQYQSGKNNRIEGIKIRKPMKNSTLMEEMIRIKESIQSGISYAGGNDLKCFNNVEYIIVK